MKNIKKIFKKYKKWSIPIWVLLFSISLLLLKQLDQSKLSQKKQWEGGTLHTDYVEVLIDVSPITVSGKVYSDEGTTPLGTQPTVRVKVDGLGDYSTIAALNGTYSISGIDLTGSPGHMSVITVFLDNSTEKAVTVTRGKDATSDITGLDLYQNRLILRHEDTNPITNSDLGQYDKNNDSDIHFTSNSGVLIVDDDTGLYIWTGKTFSETNNVTVYNGRVVGNGTINCTGGTFLVDGSGSFGGNTDWTFYNLTFGDGSGTTTTTATGTGNTIVSNVLTIASNQTLDASDDTWILTGSGTPFVINGVFNYQTSTFRYVTALGDANITATSYYILEIFGG